MNVKLSLAGEKKVPSQQLPQSTWFNAYMDSQALKKRIVFSNLSNNVQGFKGHRRPVQEAFILPPCNSEPGNTLQILTRTCNTLGSKATTRQI